MNFMEAMLSKRPIRRTIWDKGIHLIWQGHGWDLYGPTERLSSWVRFAYPDVVAEDWAFVVVELPVPITRTQVLDAWEHCFGSPNTPGEPSEMCSLFMKRLGLPPNA